MLLCYQRALLYILTFCANTFFEVYFYTNKYDVHRLVNQELGKAWKLLDQETKLKYTVTKPNPTEELIKKCPRNPFALFVREYFADLRKDPQYLNTSSRDVYRKAGVVWGGKSPEEKEKYCLMFVEERRKM